MIELVTKKVEWRFWKKVRKSSGCWNWIAHKRGHGYGGFFLGKGMVRSNRLAWVIANKKDIPDGLHVLHTCDNPKCCNPKHLFLGTHQENMGDRNNKGRCASLKGEANGNSVLTKEIVEKIKLDYSKGLSQREVAKRYGIVHSTVGSILRGTLWGETHGGVNLSRKDRGENSSRSKLNEKKVKDIRKLKKLGFEQKEICSMFKISPSVVSEIVNRKAWKHV